LRRPTHLQRFAEPFVLDDGAPIDARDPVEGAVGQGQALMTDLDPAGREVIDDDLLAGQGGRCRSLSMPAGLAKRRLSSAMKAGGRALPAASLPPQAIEIRRIAKSRH
jgi:hypothetical protein